MQPTLTEQNISQLRDYTQRMHIAYKDVEWEIVDHLACGVEEVLEKDAAKSFNRALYDFTSTLPHGFFNQFAESKEKALRRYYYKLFLDFGISFITLPKMFITAALVMAFYTGFLLLGANFFLYAYGVVLIGGLIYNAMGKSPDVRPRHLKNYLFIKIRAEVIGVMFFFIFFSGSFMMKYPMDYVYAYAFIPWTLSFYLSIVTLYAYFSRAVLLPKMKAAIEKKYAHLNIDLAWI